MTEFQLQRRCTGLCQCCDKEVISKDEIRKVIKKFTWVDRNADAYIEIDILIKELEL